MHQSTSRTDLMCMAMPSFRVVHSCIDASL